MILYHYTDARGYNGITSTNVLMPSTDAMIDAAHGPGHYFTDLSPDMCDRLIAKHCWRDKFKTDNVRYFLKCDIPVGIPKPCLGQPHVYLVPIGALRNFNLSDKGPKPNCALKPCDKCRFDPPA